MGSLEFSKLLIQECKVAVSPGIGFGEYGEGHVRFALVENEQRIRQALRGLKTLRLPAEAPARRPSDRMNEIRIGLLGLGTVGGGVVKILQTPRRRDGGARRLPARARPPSPTPTSRARARASTWRACR